MYSRSSNNNLRFFSLSLQSARLVLGQALKSIDRCLRASKRKTKCPYLQTLGKQVVTESYNEDLNGLILRTNTR